MIFSRFLFFRAYFVKVSKRNILSYNEVVFKKGFLMRILRILLLILFVATSVVFGIDRYRSYKDRDNKAPVISISEEVIHLSVNATDADLLKGVTAEDDRDGNVTSTLVIAGKSNFIEEGVTRIDYAAFDSHNNVGTGSRRVVFDDYHSPRFASEEPLVLRSESSYDFSFFSAEDVLDGDISSKIKIISDSYTTETSSEYPIELEVTNSYGDVEKLSLSLDVLAAKDYNYPRPALSEYIVYVPVGGTLDPESYLIGIRQGDKTVDFEETDYTIENIEIEDNTDYDTPGKYTVEFVLWRTATAYTETKMIVIVTEDF